MDAAAEFRRRLEALMERDFGTTSPREAFDTTQYGPRPRPNPMSLDARGYEIPEPPAPPQPPSVADLGPEFKPLGPAAPTAPATGLDPAFKPLGPAAPPPPGSTFGSLGLGARTASEGVQRGAVNAAGLAVEGAGALLTPEDYAESAGLFAEIARAGEMSDPELNLLREKIRAQTQIKPDAAFRVIEDVRSGIMPPEEVPRALGELAGLRTASDTLKETGPAIREWGAETFKASPGFEGGWIDKLSEAAGSTVPLAGAAMLPGGQILTAALSGTMGSGEAYSRALEAGASEEEALTAAAFALGPGLTDMVPIEVLLAPKVIAGVAGAVKQIGIQALVEGGQEVVQQILQNVIAQQVYDPEQEIIEGTGESAVIGGGVGAIMETGRQVGGAILNRALGRRGATPGGQPATPPAPAAPPPVPDPAGTVSPTAPPAGAGAGATPQGPAPAPAPTSPAPVTPPVQPAPAPSAEPEDEVVTVAPNLSVTPEERALLREMGNADEDIDLMSDEERAAEIELAGEAGIEVDETAVAEAATYGKGGVDAGEPAGASGTERPGAAGGDPVQPPAAAGASEPAGDPGQPVDVGGVGAGAGPRPAAPGDAGAAPAGSGGGRAAEGDPGAAGARPAEVGRDDVTDAFDQVFDEEGVTTPATTGDGSRQRPVRATTDADLEAARDRVQDPTEAQAAAGNYRKGHVKIGPLEVSIETPRGTLRRNKDPEGPKWEVEMPGDYGQIKGTTGADGDPIDITIGPDLEQKKVYLIDQFDADTGAFDEHKTFTGVASREEAEALYDASFSDGRGPARRGTIHEYPDAETFLDSLGPERRLPKRPLAASRPSKPGAEPAPAAAPDTDDSNLAPGEKRPNANALTRAEAIAALARRFPEVFKDRDTARAWLTQYGSSGGFKNQSGWFDIERLAEAVKKAKDGTYPVTPDVEIIDSEDGEFEVHVYRRPIGDYGWLMVHTETGEVTAWREGNVKDLETARFAARRAIERVGSKAKEPAEPAPAKPERSPEREEELSRPRPTRAREVNKRLPEGYELVNGGGYWYFIGPEGTTEAWPKTSVYVNNLGDLTIDQWVAEFEALKAAGDKRIAETKEGAADSRTRPQPAGEITARRREQIIMAVWHALANGEKFTIVEARKLVHQYIPGASDKVVEELFEAGVVNRARTIIGARVHGGDALKEFDALVDLYARQPRLTTRTSTSMEQQAYSTPAPLAFLAARLAGATWGPRVYEPTAGNGMLLIGVDPKQTVANEINPDRAANLRVIYGNSLTIHEGDATTYDPEGEFDVIIANPPFGKLRRDDQSARHWMLDGRVHPEIDHVIAWKALSQMKAGGRAVLIIGGKRGTDEERLQGYRSANSGAFFRKLYDRYNVVDHFSVAGKLYERQGASWPVDVIVIDGLGKSALSYPMQTVPPMLGSWDAVKGKLNDRVQTGEQRGDAGSGAAPRGPDGGADGNAVPGGSDRADQPAGGQDPAGGSAAAAGDPGSERGPVGQAGDAGRPAGVEQRPAGDGERAGGEAAGGRDQGRPDGEGVPRGGDVGGVSEPPVSDDVTSAFDQVFDEEGIGAAAAPVEVPPSPLAGLDIYTSGAGSPLISTGVVFRTASGRETAPVPKIDADNNRRRAASIRRLDEWLVKEASLEQPDNRTVQSITLGNVSPHDREFLFDVIFDDIDGPTPEQVVRIEAPAEKAPTPKKTVEEQIRAHPAVESYTANAGEHFVNLKPGYEWSGQRSFGAETAEEALRLVRKVRPVLSQPAPAPAPTNPKSVAEAGASAVKNTALGLNDVADGLANLFGGPKVSSGFTFDEDTYAKAKPYFRAGLQHFAAAGQDVVALARALVKALKDTYSFTNEMLQRMRPYMERFIRDVRDGVEKLFEDPAKPRDRQRPARENTEAETNYQVRYAPRSQAQYAVGTLVPKNMQAAITKSLRALEERVGDIDEYVATKLGYDLDDMLGTPDKNGYFSAEQVDALAQAIDNVDRGGGFIIGDQTGVGKGRIVAGMIRYALRSGKTPIFFTEKAGLYGDMVRDLRAIGMGDDVVKQILVTDEKMRASKSIPLDPSNPADVLESPKPENHKSAIIRSTNEGRLVDGFKILFTTYSQTNFKNGQPYPRHAMLEALAPNALFILDESHNAGGTDTPPEVDKITGVVKPRRSDWIRQILAGAQGAIYSSATYAKNPVVMSLYFKTELGNAVQPADRLADTIKGGGVPLQQVTANMLTDGGQYVRRERSFEGVEMNMEQFQTDATAAEQGTTAIRTVFDVDRDHMEEAREGFIQSLMASGNSGVGSGNAVGQQSITGTGFAQVMHNVVSQMLLSLKAKSVVDKAIALHEAGEKPIIALANTNAAILEDYIEQEGLAPGARVNITFNVILDRYLKRLRRVTVKDPNGVISYVHMTDADILEFGGEEALAAYQEAETFIKNIDMTGLPASPIDYIRDRLAAAGMKVDEITGRDKMIQKGVLKGRVSTPRAKKMAMYDFNSGKLDALVINASGATGFSLHAAKSSAREPNDEKPRHMLLLQPNPNIDIFMQMLGRIHRTGQVKLPKYTLGISDLAVEKRVAAVLMRKMASLNANTTAAKGSAVSIEGAVDFMNKYGDEVVADYLRNNPDVAAMLDVSPKGDSIDDLAAKFTGRLAIMPAKEVERIYDDIEHAYREYIEALDRMGQNALEAKTLDLKAKTLSQFTLVPGRDGDGPFDQPATVERVEVDRIGEPYTPEEVVAEINRELDGKTPQTYVSTINATLRGKLPAAHKKADEAIERLTERMEAATSDAQKHRFDHQIAVWTTAKANIDSTLVTIADTLRGLQPGTMGTVAYRVDDQNTINVPAVVLGIDTRRMRDNPTAASTIVVRLALGDASREIRVPLSQMLGDAPRYRFDERIGNVLGDPVPAVGRMADGTEIFPGDKVGFTDWRDRSQRYAGTVTGKGRDPNVRFQDDMVAVRMENGSTRYVGEWNIVELTEIDNDARVARGPVNPAVEAALDAFKAGRTVREDREVITGNLLAGFAAFRRGQFIMFTDTEGVVRQGILLPRNFDAAAELDNLPVQFPEVAQVVRFLAEGDPNRRMVKSEDGALSIARNDSGGFTLTVRVMGGRPYLLLGPVRQIIGDFENSRNKSLIHKRVTEAQLGPVLQAYADNLGTTYFTDASRDEARAIVGGGAVGQVEVMDGGPTPGTAQSKPRPSAAWTDERIDAEIQNHGTSYDDRTNAYVAMVDPMDFVRATTSDEDHVNQIIREAGSLDPARLRKETQTPFLVIGKGDQRRTIGMIYGHEGRHRMAALAGAGVKSAPVKIIFDQRIDRDEKPKATIQGEVYTAQNVDVGPMVPINDKNRDRIRAMMTPSPLVAYDRSRPDFSKAVDKALNDGLAADIRGAVRSIVGDGVTVEFPERIRVEGSPGWGDPNPFDAAGQFNFEKRLLEVSLTSADSQWTAFHEIGHALQQLYTPQERALLKAEAPRIKAMLKASFWRLPDETLDAMKPLEIEAEGFVAFVSDSLAGRPAGVGVHIGVRRLWARLLQLVRRIRNLAAGYGFQTYEDLFERAMRGEMRNRPVSPWTQGEVDWLTQGEIPDTAAARGWHGSPYRFPRFDFSHMGRGEGAQAFGWGMYFADIRGIAEGYRAVLSRKRGTAGESRYHTYKGQKITPEMHRDLRENGTDGERAVFGAVNYERSFVGAADARQYGLKAYLEYREKLFNEQVDKAAKRKASHGEDAIWRAERDMAEFMRLKFNEAKAVIDDIGYKEPGHLYEVEIPDADNLMDWSAPLDAQPPAVKAALAKVKIDRGLNRWFGWMLGTSSASRRVAAMLDGKGKGWQTGEDFYRDLSLALGSDMFASKALAAAGIPGHRFLDGFSRNKGTGTYNYVIYDEAVIQIVNVHHRPSPVAPPPGGNPGQMAANVNQTFRQLRSITNTRDRLRVKLQDRFLSVKRDQQRVAETGILDVTDATNTYEAESRYYGMAGERIENLTAKHVEPLVDFMDRHAIEVHELDNYLYARHALERNREILSRTRGTPLETDMGSGMSDAEAQAMLLAVDADPRAAEIKEAARMVDAITAESLQRDLDAGLRSADEVKDLKAMYQHYVPLRGFKEIDTSDPEFARVGKGFDVRGRENMTAFGRKSVADSPVAYTILQAQQSIIRSEKNRVMKTFLRYVQKVNDPDRYHVVKGEYRKRFNPDTGLVEKYFVPAVSLKNDPNLVFAKVGGVQKAIRINDPDLLRALRQMGSVETDEFVRGLMRISRFYAMLQTQLNPEFVAPNFLRDLTTALVNVSDTEGLPDGTRRKIAKNVVGSVKDIFRSLRNGQPTGPRGALWDEFRMEGGKTNFGMIQNIEAIKSSLKPGRMTWRKLKHLGKVIADLNDAIENGARLATYIALREAKDPAGRPLFTKAKAAVIAKEVTVNFNRRGEWSQVINALWIFFNASLQGTTRILTAIGRSRTVQGLVAAMVVGGMLQDQLNAFLAGMGDDEEERNAWDNLEEWKKERNFIIMIPGSTEYLSIPLPYGYSWFFNSGRLGSALARGQKGLTAGDVAMHMAITLMDNFNPMGSAPSLLQWAAPTFIDPLVQVETNESWNGIPIMPRKFNDLEPDSEVYYDSVNEGARVAAETLNEITGGSKGRPGFIDVSPETLQHITEFMGGGLGRFVLRSGELVGTFAQGEVPDFRDVPILRSLAGSVGTVQSARNTFYETRDAVYQAEYEAKALEKDGDREGVRRVRGAYRAELAVLDRFKETTKAMREIRDERSAIYKRDLPLDRRKAALERLDEKERRLVSRALEAYQRARERNER